MNQNKKSLRKTSINYELNKNYFITIKLLLFTMMMIKKIKLQYQVLSEETYHIVIYCMFYF